MGMRVKASRQFKSRMESTFFEPKRMKKIKTFRAGDQMLSTTE